ncbi:hypothetical protein LOH54_01395 [Sulfurimonas sp. HSL-3221]|uniref:hypothetical protein n=1 Tax=Thiomicrolovo sulfuroxydans TaxID=2894755 RepID=UPI001E40DAB3|nr:hypothetical protein [Sulfurimonas sp. HSL-3221]UFS62795.1 hypothetical protein LOH54_01395 [Sulfurimonas sp. HSL-3221]
MKLTYAGPKPLISHSGIVFDRKKEDKYRYIPFIVSLLLALDHDYTSSQNYTYTPDRKHYSDEELLRIIAAHCQNAKTEAQRRLSDKAAELDEELRRVQSALSLSAEARAVLRTNLMLMRDYRLQRTVNKSFYYSAAAALVTLVAAKRLRYIQTPFTPEYFHVFHTMEGIIRRRRLALAAQLEVYEEKGELMVRLALAGR